MAEFGVHLSIVEIGGTRTGFATAIRFTGETEPYRHGATGRVAFLRVTQRPATLTSAAMPPRAIIQRNAQ